MEKINTDGFGARLRPHSARIQHSRCSREHGRLSPVLEDLVYRVFSSECQTKPKAHIQHTIHKQHRKISGCEDWQDQIHDTGGKLRGVLETYLDAMKGVMSNSRGKETYVVIFLRSLAECSNRWSWPEREAQTPAGNSNASITTATALTSSVPLRDSLQQLGVCEVLR
ncbi:hypothetical protein EYF80_017099 [Liparis tanakae]|uniref:Uncharacterized protein n=1 Tax=Liparis tanakae TaxID=230148 RepID=A0A4Z2I4A6_9TELE|nr:hypothetical protein EYF80_017099 [Liparis tanakae]